MGKNKLLLPYKGKCVFEHPLELALRYSDAVICVTGYQKDIIEGLLKKYPVTTIYNENYELGQKSSSIKALEEIDDDVAFLAGDYPLINSNDYLKGISELKIYPAARPVFNGEPGHPVFVRKEIAAEMRTEPRPFSSFLKTKGIHYYEGSPGCIYDIDTPEAYIRLINE